MWSSRCVGAIIGRHLLPHRHISPVVQHCVRWQPICSSAARLRALPSHWGSNKTNRKITVAVGERTAEQETVLEPLRLAVREQGDHVRALKAIESTNPGDVKTAVSELKRRKKVLEEMEMQLSQNPITFDRFKLEDLLRRRFFYDQSFAIYGGVSGQYDFGPMGCALLGNILNVWREHFVLTDDMLEVECSTLTPAAVLQASGHIERFVDVMVKDVGTGECFRLDHLLKQHFESMVQSSQYAAVAKSCNETIAKLDGMSQSEMSALLLAHNIRAPNTGNELSEPVAFNLMFATHIGNGKGLAQRRFLRPETAQGIFLNYRRLLQHNGGRLPFAAAQIGTAFRNEIAPRSGLLRVREFTMAEIEHFCAPGDQSHAKFGTVRHLELRLLSACDQMEGKASTVMSLAEAVTSGLVANETLAYYLGRIQEFLLSIGIRDDRLRFRQHLSNEMAHYASDCWDAEILTSYGWIECVGCADRGVYDLTQHANATENFLSSVSTEDRLIPSTPSVIEPSFGIGRIMYALLEHRFAMRPGDDQRSYLALPATVAPFKCSVLPLSNNVAAFRPVIDRIAHDLTAAKVFHKEDSSSGSIGRRYARTDEIGIPYAITVDYETTQAQPATVTLRERDSMQQVRVPVSSVAAIVRMLSSGELTWPELSGAGPDAASINTYDSAAEPTTKSPASVRRELVEQIHKAGQFVHDDSFVVYGSHRGHRDFGPLGCALKAHILDCWSDWFVMAEQMLPMKCAVLTPEAAMDASGQAERFADVAVREVGGSNDGYGRLDHVLREGFAELERNSTDAEVRRQCTTNMAKLSGLSHTELTALLKSTETIATKFMEPTTSSVLLSTSIGPTGTLSAYLRPESATGLLVNFKRLLEFNAGKLPFVAAHIGTVYRNELAASADLLYNYEFTVAEFVHFGDPDRMEHEKFDRVRDVYLPVHSDGVVSQVSIGDGVQAGMFSSETLAYYLVRVQQFLLEIGVRSDGIRFRRRLTSEMDPSSTMCWDAELLTGSGWTNCVRFADRSTIDLKRHAQATGIKLTAEKTLTTPKTVDVVEVVPNKSAIRRAHQKDTRAICEQLAALDSDQLLQLKAELDNNGAFSLGHWTIGSDMVTMRLVKKTVHVEDVAPNVVHVSLGVGRVMQALLEDYS